MKTEPFDTDAEVSSQWRSLLLANLVRAKLNNAVNGAADDGIRCVLEAHTLQRSSNVAELRQMSL
jgi:hypothetical protein